MQPEKKKILLIEDDGTLRNLYVDLFQNAGFEVEQAVEGKEGLEKITQGGYDLILTDVLLPGLSGQDILRAIRENPPQKKNGPIVILTNQENDEIHQQCLELGVSGILIKSKLSPDELLTKIKGYLETT